MPPAIGFFQALALDQLCCCRGTAPHSPVCRPSAGRESAIAVDLKRGFLRSRSSCFARFTTHISPVAAGHEHARFVRGGHNARCMGKSAVIHHDGLNQERLNQMRFERGQGQICQLRCACAARGAPSRTPSGFQWTAGHNRPAGQVERLPGQTPVRVGHGPGPCPASSGQRQGVTSAIPAMPPQGVSAPDHVGFRRVGRPISPQGCRSAPSGWAVARWAAVTGYDGCCAVAPPVAANAARHSTACVRASRPGLFECMEKRPTLSHWRRTDARRAWRLNA